MMRSEINAMSLAVLGFKSTFPGLKPYMLLTVQGLKTSEDKKLNINPLPHNADL